MKALDEEVANFGRSIAEIGDSHDIEKQIGDQQATLAEMDDIIDEFEWQTQYLYDETNLITRRKIDQSPL
jgi:hypothetical protein